MANEFLEILESMTEPQTEPDNWAGALLLETIPAEMKIGLKIDARELAARIREQAQAVILSLIASEIRAAIPAAEPGAVAGAARLLCNKAGI